MPQRKTRRTPTRMETPARKLSAGDLQELRLRHQAALIAAHQHLMVKEAYEKWLASKAAEYGVQGKYNVDIQTGEITCPI